MTEDLDDQIRRTDPDRWLSSRFIGDAQARADVIALYAYDYELARAPKVASNSLLGEIRLTWWNEVLDEIYEGRDVRRHPTAQALADVVKRHGLSRAAGGDDRRRYRELDATPMAEAEALDWARGTGGRVAQVAARILDPALDGETAVAAGAAWALARKGLPLQDVDAARAGARKLTAAAFPAVAHAALVLRPTHSDFARQARLIWAVARGRV